MATLYGRVVDGALDGPIRRPRNSGETKLLDGTTIRPGGKGWTPSLLNACGLIEANIVRPAIDASTEVEDGYDDALNDGVPTRTYRKRPKSSDELAEDARRATVAAQRDADEAAMRNLLDAPTATTATLHNVVKAIIRQHFPHVEERRTPGATGPTAGKP